MPTVLPVREPRSMFNADSLPLFVKTKALSEPSPRPTRNHGPRRPRKSPASESARLRDKPSTLASVHSKLPNGVIHRQSKKTTGNLIQSSGSHEFAADPRSSDTLAESGPRTEQVMLSNVDHGINSQFSMHAQACMESGTRIMSGHDRVLVLRKGVDEERRHLKRFKHHLDESDRGLRRVLEQAQSSLNNSSIPRILWLLNENSMHRERYMAQVGNVERADKALCTLEAATRDGEEAFIDALGILREFLQLAGPSQVDFPSPAQPEQSGEGDYSIFDEYPITQREHWDKIGDLKVLRERLIYIEHDHAEERADRIFKEDQEQALEVSEEQFENVYQEQLRDLRDEIAQTEMQVEHLRRQCLDEGIDPDLLPNSSAEDAESSVSGTTRLWRPDADGGQVAAVLEAEAARSDRSAVSISPDASSLTVESIINWTRDISEGPTDDDTIT